MYASQWFLTIYTVKFPLPFVYRIMDIVLCEGLDTMFRVALALLKASRNQLMQQDFEGVLKHFRVALPKRYSSDKETNHLIAQAVSIKIDRKRLRKLEKEYQAMKEAEAALEDPVARLEKDNKRLQETNLRLEQENDTLAQELVASKIALRQEMDKLEQRIDRLSKDKRIALEERDKADRQSQQSQEEATQLRALYQKTVLELGMERQHHQVEMAEYKQMCQQLDERNQQAQDDLKQELLEVKARLGNNISEGTIDGAESVDTNTIPIDPSMLSSEQRLRELEMELAHYKLQLVEAQCRIQDLERRLKAQANPGTSAKKGLLSKLKSFNS
jgi:predicted  nucleic acid-binding Zn-ribbon protein